MIIRDATINDLSDYYAELLTPCEKFVGIVGLIDEKIVSVAGLCFATGRPTIAISDYDDRVGNKDRVIFGRLAMKILEDYGDLVWAICSNPKSKNVLERLGFKFVSREHDRDVMSWEPGPISFRALVDQLGLDSRQFTQAEIIDLIGYGLDTQIESTVDELEAKAKRYFCNGVYIKELLVPKGTLMVGKIHKTEHQCIMTCGDVSLMTQDKHVRMKGHNVFSAHKNTRRVGYFHEDTMWLNVHASHGITDVAEMEDHLLRTSDITWVYDLVNGPR